MSLLQRRRNILAQLPKEVFEGTEVNVPYQASPGQDVFYHLGTVDNTQAWAFPPYERGALIRYRRLYSGTGVTFNAGIDRNSGTRMQFHLSALHGEDPSWYEVDLGVRRSLSITGYAVQNRADTSAGIIQNWKIQGSNDRVVWTDVHSVGTPPNGAVGAWNGYSNLPPSPYFRYIRIYQTGPDRNGWDAWIFSEFEFYGNLRRGNFDDYTHPPSDATMYSTTSLINGIVATVSGTQQGSAANMTNNTPNSHWLSKDVAGSWCYWNAGVGNKFDVRHFTLRPRNDATTHYIRSFALEGSDDAVNWTVIENFNTPRHELAHHVYEIAAPQAFRYILIRATGLNYANTRYMGFSHVGMYGNLV